MENYARLAALLGPARLKDIIFTARTIEAEEALAIGLATEVVEADRAEARVEELCELLASHAPVTLRVTKEALRRIRAATTPDGDDLVREAYGSEGFRRNVAAFLARSARPGMSEVEADDRLRRRGADPDRGAQPRARAQGREARAAGAHPAVAVRPAAAARRRRRGRAGGPRRARAATSAAGRAGRSRSSPPPSSASPRPLSAWLARRRGRIEPLGWAAITLLAADRAGVLGRPGRARPRAALMEAESVPRLETPRLILRGWRPDDAEAHAAMTADPEVMRHLGGVLSAAQSWRALAQNAGHWVLRGYGQWAIERRADGQLLGRAGLWNPDGWPGVEIGWVLARHAWGQGYATEAARAALQWTWASVETDQLISLIAPGNAASIRVAERLGLDRLREHALDGRAVLIYGIDRPGDPWLRTATRA